MDKKKTEVAKVIASLALNPEEISKDKQSKIALRNPAIAAYIAKQVIPELRDIKIHDIVKKYFVGEPFVKLCEIPEDAPQIMGVGTENRDISQTDSNFDVCAVLVLNPDEPDDGKKKYVILNIEPQNKFYTTYPLAARQMLYVSRLISSQLPTAPANYAYAHLSKVYSVWIFFDPPQYAENSINIVKSEQKCTDGNYTDKKEAFDLYEIWQVMLGNEGENEGPNKELLDFLDVLFSKTLSLEERLGFMEKKGIRLNKNGRETIKIMTEEMLKYQSVTYQRGYKEGEVKGKEKGRAEGRAEQLMENIIALNGVVAPEVMAEKFKLPLQQVLDILAEADKPET